MIKLSANTRLAIHPNNVHNFDRACQQGAWTGREPPIGQLDDWILDATRLEVIVSRDEQDEGFLRAVKWCAENTRRGFAFSISGYALYFQCKDDAMVFKLAWM